jgi:hypothetical protein
MIHPFIPTIHIENWQSNGFPVMAAFNVSIQGHAINDTGEALRSGLPSEMMPEETLLLKTEPYPHWQNPWDTWVRCRVSMDSSDTNPPRLQLWRGGEWTDVTDRESDVLMPRIKGRLKRVAKSLWEAASGMPDHDA